MLEHGDLRYRHRGVATPKKIEKCVEELLKLEGDTQPMAGDGTAVDKTAAAHRAMWLAKDLVDYLAGWAVDHIAGCTIADEWPAYKEDRPLSKYDTHKYEAASAEYQQDDPRSNRHILASLINFEIGLPTGLGLEAWHALAALDAGEVQSLVAPDKRGLHGRAYSLARLRLKALELVAYRRGTGMSALDAREKVGHKFGAGERTIETWRTRLWDELGKFTVRGAEARARYIGNLIRDRNLDDINDTNLEPNDLRSEFGDTALEAAAENYRRILAESA
jgi:hypothetical protein